MASQENKDENQGEGGYEEEVFEDDFENEEVKEIKRYVCSALIYFLVITTYIFVVFLIPPTLQRMNQ